MPQVLIAGQVHTTGLAMPKAARDLPFDCVEQIPEASHAPLNGRRIALAEYGDANSTSVAEHAVMIMLAASTRLLRADSAVRHGPWNRRRDLEAQDLRSRTLLLAGHGRVGPRMAVGSVQDVPDFFAGRIDPARVASKGHLDGTQQT